MEPQYVGLTQRGRRKVIQNRYAYVKEKDGPGAVSYWRCERKDELRCKGRMKMDGDLLVTTTGVHCHGPDPLKEATTKVKDTITERAAGTQESTHSIVQNAMIAAPVEASCQLPSVRSLKRKAQRDRIKAKNVPPNPGSLQELIVPPDYCETLSGDFFLLHDSGAGTGKQPLPCVFNHG